MEDSGGDSGGNNLTAVVLCSPVVATQEQPDLKEANPMHVKPEVNPIIGNGTYSQESVDRIVTTTPRQRECRCRVQGKRESILEKASRA